MLPGIDDDADIAVIGDVGVYRTVRRLVLSSDVGGNQRRHSPEWEPCSVEQMPGSSLVIDRDVTALRFFIWCLTNEPSIQQLIWDFVHAKPDVGIELQSLTGELLLWLERFLKASHPLLLLRLLVNVVAFGLVRSAEGRESQGLLRFE